MHAPPATNAEFESLLDYLKRTRGFDFRGYKRASLTRRVDRRLQEVGVSGYASYVDYLEVHPGEFEELFNAVLINVTAFFRDPDAWARLAEEVVPQLVERKGGDEPLRVWSVGCASGEEAYTLAIVLAEAVGPEAFTERVKVYATDVDDDALARARQATYTEEQIAGVPEALRDKYFERAAGGRRTFRADLRRSVIFGRHNLAADAPISRVDVLVCRNALMYFNAETQYRALVRFHFALNEGGVLFLGRAETLLTRTNLFAPLDLKRRLFVKTARPGRRDRVTALASELERNNLLPRTNGALDRAREAAFDASPVAQLVMSADGLLVAANERARALFTIRPTDLGRPLQDLELSYRPLELRSRIDELYVTRRPITVAGVSWPGAGGEVRAYDVQLTALDGSGGGSSGSGGSGGNGGNGGGDASDDGAAAPLGVTITFTDTTEGTRLRRELEHANQEIETAYEELQSTNEELETTNEELQSTVEELETTNEELQSTNEELETMNEELQSTNEELQTINDEVRRGSQELQRVNLFLEAVLTSWRGGVVVLDRELRVTVWNQQSAELWGVRADEAVGQHFANLDIGLSVDALRHAIRLCVSGESPLERLTVDATNRRGKPIQCSVTCTPLRIDDETPRGVILVME